MKTVVIHADNVFRLSTSGVIRDQSLDISLPEDTFNDFKLGNLYSFSKRDHEFVPRVKLPSMDDFKDTHYANMKIVSIPHMDMSVQFPPDMLNEFKSNGLDHQDIRAMYGALLIKRVAESKREWLLFEEDEQLILIMGN